jgi:hypothetical protein
MQSEITKPTALLDENGLITKQGWARHPYWRYDRNAIKTGWLRIKEWDYYAVLSADKKYGITFTMSDLGYVGLFAICWLDFENRSCTQVETLNFLPMGKTGFSPDSDSGSITFSDKKLSLEFITKDRKRILKFSCPCLVDSKGQSGLSGEITLSQPQDLESMVIATSWKENRKAFYYNRKINCMPAKGEVTIGKNRYVFDPSIDFGTLDWGRGNWTYKNRWYWGSASGLLDGHTFGWNIGYGFSDRTPASENVIFYNGKAHKIEDVTFHIDTKNYMAPWKFTSSDKRFEMNFEPIIDRKAKINVGLIRTDQHQVFGYFTGQAILDDGTRLNVNRFLGFAEDVLNWW